MTPARAAVAGALTLLAAALVACSSGDGGGALAAPPTSAPAQRSPTVDATAPSDGGPTTTSSPATAAAEPCSSSMLTVATREGLGALGHALYVLQMRNTSPQACRMTGYPAVSLLTNDGRMLAQAQPGAGYILPDRPPAAVSVASGGSAYFGVESYNVCNGGVDPSVAQNVRITPPGAVGALSLSAEMNVCPSQPVRVSPVRATERDIAP